MRIKTETVYRFLISVCFFITVFSFAFFNKTMCLRGDDYYILMYSFRNILVADHGNYLHVLTHFILNFKLPMLFHVHPQVFLRSVNIYIYGIIFFLVFYNLCRSAFLFKKNNLSLPLYILTTFAIFFSIAVKTDTVHGWMTYESCTFLRYSFAMLFLYIFLNFFIRNLLREKIRIKNYISAFLLGLLCANASEFNAFISFLSLAVISPFCLFWKKNKNKLFTFSMCAISGIISGIICIVINPGFQDAFTAKTEDVERTFNFSLLVKEVLGIYSEQKIIFLLLYVFLSVLIFLAYKRKLFYKITLIAFSLFAACNLFYAVLAIVAAPELFHGDLRILFYGILTYISLFLFGAVCRKIKSKTLYSLIIAVITLLAGIFLHSVYSDTVYCAKYLRDINQKESVYLYQTEKDFFDQYRTGKSVIHLKSDNERLPFFYHEQYIEDFLPMYYQDIDKESYVIEWSDI